MPVDRISSQRYRDIGILRYVTKPMVYSTVNFNAGIPRIPNRFALDTEDRRNAKASLDVKWYNEVVMVDWWV